MTDPPAFELNCPLPFEQPERVLLAHGGGGRLMQNLLQDTLFPAFANPFLAAAHDGARLVLGNQVLAFSCDSYVVHPLFFAGGDIGSMAVFGTVNDLAMCGAKPLYLSVGLILEEGLEMAVLQRVVASMAEAAKRCGVLLVTGDTKVVEKGKGDGLFIHTAGIGLIETPLEIGPQQVKVGDAILINGEIGAHGMAVMAEREGLAFEGPIKSDCAPLHELVCELLTAGFELHCLRDPTRGGVASVLNEIAAQAELQIELKAAQIPIDPAVASACEILGFDPLYVANEGKMLIFLPQAQAEAALARLHSHPLGRNAAQIGVVQTGDPRVILHNPYGTTRLLDLLSGEQLPRIC